MRRYFFPLDQGHRPSRTLSKQNKFCLQENFFDEKAGLEPRAYENSGEPRFSG